MFDHSSCPLLSNSHKRRALRRVASSVAFAALAGGCSAGSPATDVQRAAEALTVSSSTFVPFGWNATWDRLDGAAVGSPIITSLNANLSDAFELRADHHLYHRRWNGTSWLPWEDKGNMGKPIDSFTAVAHGNLVEVFAHEAGTLNLLYRTLTALGTWGAWQNFDGRFIGTPAAVTATYATNDTGLFASPTTTTTYVVVRAPDNTVWAREGTGGMFAGWYQVGGWINTDPVLFSTGGHVELMVRGLDGGLYRQWRDSGKGWQKDYTPLSGQLAGPPVVAGSSPSDVWAVANFVDKTMQYRHFDGTNWSPWSRMGDGKPWSDELDLEPARPMAFSTGLNTIHVLVQGTDRQLWDMPSDNGWRGTPIASCFQRNGTPSIAFVDSSTVDLAVFDTNMGLWRTRYQMFPSTAGQSPPACPAGQVGQECKYGNVCATGVCEEQDTTTTSAMMCVACGGQNQPCCPAPTYAFEGLGSCNSGFSCWKNPDQLENHMPLRCEPASHYKVQIDSVKVGQDSYGMNYDANMIDWREDGHPRADLFALGLRKTRMDGDTSNPPGTETLPVVSCVYGNNDPPAVALTSNPLNPIPPFALDGLGFPVPWEPSWAYPQAPLNTCVSGLFASGPLSQGVDIDGPDDRLEIALIANNIENGDAKASGNTLATAGNAFAAAGAVMSVIPAVNTAGAIVGAAGAVMSLAAGLDSSRIDCRGGLVANLPTGYAADTIYVGMNGSTDIGKPSGNIYFTGEQLRALTAGGPLVMPLQLAVGSPSGHCQSFHTVNLSISRTR